MLPPFQQFWDELTFLFEWLEGRREAAPLVSIPTGRDEQAAWSPPPTISTWRSSVPLETIRFAASNRLLVELGYRGSIRLIEPYSLRRTRDGNLILHALRADNRQHRSYRVDMIESVRSTTTPFRPVYAVEFSSRGSMAAPATAQRSPGARALGEPPERSLLSFFCSQPVVVVTATGLISRRLSSRPPTSSSTRTRCRRGSRRSWGSTRSPSWRMRRAD